MTRLDPHRTLGVAPDASQAEIKRAYRRLAKQYHPDSGGDRQLTRFLAIQAAYETLIQGGPRPGTARPAARAAESPAWQADPDRARATRDAYRARRRSPGPDAAGSGGGASRGTGSATGTRADADGKRGASDERASAGSADGPDRSSGAGGAAAGPSGRTRRRPKATIGSTSYDGVDREPFDPAWDGATWYGAGSGTYWTVNPKEYADPRKHGPEYLARSRRPTVAGGRAAPTPDAPTPDARATRRSAARRCRDTGRLSGAPERSRVPRFGDHRGRSTDAGRHPSAGRDDARPAPRHRIRLAGSLG